MPVLHDHDQEEVHRLSCGGNTAICSSQETALLAAEQDSVPVAKPVLAAGEQRACHLLQLPEDLSLLLVWTWTLTTAQQASTSVHVSGACSAPLQGAAAVPALQGQHCAARSLLQPSPALMPMFFAITHTATSAIDEPKPVTPCRCRTCW